jgi:hypothetical protein
MPYALSGSNKRERERERDSIKTWGNVSTPVPFLTSAIDGYEWSV